MHVREECCAMTHPPCAEPIPYAALIEYWFGELAGDAEGRIERHLIGCAYCTAHLAELAELGSGIRSAFQGGALHTVISARFLEKMKEKGLRVREYRVAPGGSVRCTISAADDAVVSRLQAALAGVTRIDLVRLNEQGEVLSRFQDIPFDPVAGEVLVCPSADALKKMPAHTRTIRLLAVDEQGERPLADYTFNHTPS
jgi:anti-sigma factor RsiW